MNQPENPSGIVAKVWIFFVSVKLTVVLLLSLAATSIIGTFIPQNGRPIEYLQNYGEPLYRLLDAIDTVLNIFDMYHSWWFQILLILLSINIVICSINRLSVTWKIVFDKKPRFNVARFRELPDKKAFFSRSSHEDLMKPVERFIAKRVHYTVSEKTDAGIFVFGEKGRWTRLGVYIVHCSVLLLLFGGIIGSYFGFNGYVNIPEGEKVDRVLIMKSREVRQLGFEIQCDDFDMSFYASGAPKEYRSSLTILEGGQAVLKKDIIVNDPLRYKGINIYQSSFRELPPQSRGPSNSDEVVIAFTSRETGMRYEKTMRTGQSVDIPEGLGKFTINNYKAAYQFRSKSLGAVFLGTLAQKDGTDVAVILPVRFPKFDMMGSMLNEKRKSDLFIEIVGGDTGPSAAEPRYATGLQVTEDPGVWLVYAGFIMMIIGFFITFFMSHQRLSVELVPEKDQTRVAVSGTANKNKLGMQRKINSFSKALNNYLSGIVRKE